MTYSFHSNMSGGSFVAAGNNNLADERLDFAGRAADAGVVDRHIAPAEQLLPFSARSFSNRCFAIAAFVSDRAAETQCRCRNRPRGRQLDAQFAAAWR